MSITSSSEPEKFDGTAFLIGIDKYEHTFAKDLVVNHKVGEIEKFLISSQGGQYDPKNVVGFSNQEANKKKIFEVFEDWKNEKKQTTTSLFYFSGYMFSKLVEGKRQIYFCPYDTNPKDLIHSAILLDDILKILSEKPAENLIVVLNIHHPGAIDSIEDLLEWKPKLADVFRNQLEPKTNWVLLYSSPSEEVIATSSSTQTEHFSECFLEALSKSAGLRGDGVIYILDVFHTLSNAPKKLFAAALVSSPLEHNPQIGFARKQQLHFYIKAILNILLIIGLTSIYYLPFVQNLINPSSICVQPYASALSLAVVLWGGLVIFLAFKPYLGEEAEVNLVISFKFRIIALLEDIRILPKNAWISVGIAVVLAIIAVAIGFTKFSPLLQTSQLTIYGFTIDNGDFYLGGDTIHFQERRPLSISVQTSDPERTICRWFSESNPKIVRENCEFTYFFPENIEQDTIFLEASSSCGERWSNSNIFIMPDSVP